MNVFFFYLIIIFILVFDVTFAPLMIFRFSAGGPLSDPQALRSDELSR